MEHGYSGLASLKACSRRRDLLLEGTFIFVKEPLESFPGVSMRLCLPMDVFQRTCSRSSEEKALDCLFGGHDMDEGERLLRETSSEEQGFVTSALGYVKGIRTGSFVFFSKNVNTEV